METFLTIYWIIYFALTVTCIMASLDDGDIGMGFAVSFMLFLVFIFARIVVVDAFIPFKPWTVTEITDVQLIDYGYTLGIDQKLIPAGNSLVYNGLKNPKIKFYKNFRPKNELSLDQAAQTRYRAFLDGELVFESVNP